MKDICYIFKLINNNLIWFNNNINNASKMITFIPYNYSPYITVQQFQGNTHQIICGPLIQFMIQLSIQTKSK